MILQGEISTTGKVVHCLDVITKLFCRVVEDSDVAEKDESGNVYKSWNEVKQEKVGNQFSKRVDRLEVTSTQELKNMEVAARVIQKNWKKKRSSRSGNLVSVVTKARIASSGEN